MRETTSSPAVDHNRFVSSSPLYHQHVLNDCHDGRRGGTQTLGGPAGHLELSHLVLLARLQENVEKLCMVYTDMECHNYGGYLLGNFAEAVPLV